MGRRGKFRAQEPEPKYDLTRPTDPEIVRLRAHADGDRCHFCSGALSRAGAEPGRIQVFRELCVEGQRALTGAPRPREEDAPERPVDRAATSEALARLLDADGRSIEDAVRLLRLALHLPEGQ